MKQLLPLRKLLVVSKNHDDCIAIEMLKCILVHWLCCSQADHCRWSNVTDRSYQFVCRSNLTVCRFSFALSLFGGLQVFGGKRANWTFWWEIDRIVNWSNCPLTNWSKERSELVPPLQPLWRPWDQHSKVLFNSKVDPSHLLLWERWPKRALQEKFRSVWSRSIQLSMSFSSTANETWFVGAHPWFNFDQKFSANLQEWIKFRVASSFSLSLSLSISFSLSLSLSLSLSTLFLLYSVYTFF